MATYFITVSQLAEQQAFLVKDIDGVKVITTFTQSGLALGAVFGVPGAIIGAIIGVATGIFYAIFGDKKKGAMNLYRVLIAEILAQVDPGSVTFRGEHLSVKTTRPADPLIMLDIVKQMLVAFQSTFDPGTDDFNDAQEAINSVKIDTLKPCCNRTIIEFEGLENGTNNILPGSGGIAIVIGLVAAFFAR